MLRHGRLTTNVTSAVALKMALVFAVAFGALAGCSSNKKKQALREKVATQSGLYCDFVNGDKFKEIELELNLAMATKCDPDKPYSVSNYKNASEVHGLVYCCSMKRAQAKVQRPVERKSSTPLREDTENQNGTSSL